MKKFIILYLIFLHIFSSNLFARYRAYKLQIKDLNSSEIFEVTTSLSPSTYLTYYEANRSYREILTISSWMCWGNTSNFKPICKDPRESSPLIKDEVKLQQ